MSETDLCKPEPDCDDGELTERGQEDVSLESDLPSTEHHVEKRSTSTEDVDSQTEDCCYDVTWTVSIVLAVPGGEETDVQPALKHAKKKNEPSTSVLVKAHNAQSYHIEYKLLPSHTETIKVDLTVFGPLATIYKEDESKILKAWHEGDHTWVGWTENFKVRVDRDVVISLLPHKIKLNIWNSTDKLSRQARIERLKATKFPKDLLEGATDMCNVIKTMVNKLRVSSEKSSRTSQKQKSDTSCNSDSVAGSGTDMTLASQDLKDFKSDDTTSVEVSPICFFADQTSVTGHFQLCSSGVFEVMCNISLDRPLLSDRLKAELNPLVITVLSAKSMPSTPVPFQVLQEKCLPVYCQYKFHNLSTHRTNYHKHSHNIYFRDVNVILTGLMNPQELQEFLSSPPLQIEIHDRDRRLEGRAKTSAAFGTNSDDDMQSNAATFKQKIAGFNFYGVASLNLSELLRGKKSLKFYLPIKCCPQPRQLDGAQSKTDATAGRDPIPQAHYYEANSRLKVSVEVAHPLNVGDDAYDPFGRIIYLFDYNNFSVVTKLKSEILTINASALGFHLGSLENMERALSNHSKNFMHDENKDLDFVSGFHVVDERMHIFVLEGLKHKAVRRLWEAVPMTLLGNEEEHVIVHHNPSLRFFKRIYDSLDLALKPIHLSESLQTIMGQPQVYIRGLIPQPCLQALSRLSQLCQASRLKDMVEYNLFPSSDMILSMTELYGTHDGEWRQNARVSAGVNLPALPVPVKRRAQLKTHNSEYIRWKHNNQQKLCQHSRDFIQENIQNVHDKSEQLPKPKEPLIRIEITGPVHNYSTQTFNTSEQAKEQLRKQMAKMPGRRFTLSQQYHSATVEPGDRTLRDGSGFAPASARWLSSRRSDESKLHPRHLDKARVEELRKVMAFFIHQQSVERERPTRQHPEAHTFTGPMGLGPAQRGLSTLHKTSPFFGTPTVYIHLAAESLQQELSDAITAHNSRRLRAKLPGGSTDRLDGFISEFQLLVGGNSETTQGMLKDEPKKDSPQKPGCRLKPLPRLSPMKLLDNKAAAQSLAPGPCMDSSKNNSLHTSLHNKDCTSVEQYSFLDKRSALHLTDKEKRIFTSAVNPFMNTSGKAVPSKHRINS